ncbi:MAG: peptidoglycan-binding protein [Raoultibacter sp.]
MITIQKHDTGAAVEDVQQKLATLEFLLDDQVTGTFDEATAAAVSAFCGANGLETSEVVTEKVWAALVDASFQLGDRTLYLKMPYFHGHDVSQLQNALGALGFACGSNDTIFGAYTELALRKFQTNLGLPADGIAGALTYGALNNLHHSWEGKMSSQLSPYLGFARAADVLETNALCLFGTTDFTRSVASRMSNLALATNPASKIISADSLSVVPGADMLLVHIVLPGQEIQECVPRIAYEDESTLSLRLHSALKSIVATPSRIALELPSARWQDAGAGRSAQHFAITLLDALCASLAISD